MLGCLTLADALTSCWSFISHSMAALNSLAAASVWSSTCDSQGIPHIAVTVHVSPFGCRCQAPRPNLAWESFLRPHGSSDSSSQFKSPPDVCPRSLLHPFLTASQVGPQNGLKVRQLEATGALRVPTELERRHLGDVTADVTAPPWRQVFGVWCSNEST